ncbi:hypothetical protein LIER_27945 [Lithospermum erythrorhizon]|uniref:Uncharacterized protein n=1 Tax=Lithospermum erythrorhizon TaxID=34254 RepID=A0AAV3REZ3_LITER
MSIYFGKLQPLWDELGTSDPIPSCGYGICVCDLGEKFQRKQDNDRLHEFLCRVYVEKFGALRSSLLSQDLPPTLDQAYHDMLHEEQLLSQRGGQTPTAGAARPRDTAHPMCTSVGVYTGGMGLR